jgi:glutaconate CoA-transferase subunit A
VSDGAAPRSARLIDIDDAAARVQDGMTVGLSGFSHQNPPMAIVRRLVERGVRGLTLVSGPTAGIETDLLIDAGCVRRVVAAGVALERVAGIAPAFRRAAQAGEIEVWECDECIWYVALKAAAWGVPYLLWPGGVGSSLPELNPDLVEIEEGGRRFLRVPAIRPDIVFVHAAEADRYGNVRAAPRAYLGRTFAERALAEACAGPVIATVEEIVDNDRVAAEPERTLLFGADVAHAPRGAHPGGVSGRYPPDLEAMRAYVRERSAHAPPERSETSSPSAATPGAADDFPPHLRDLVICAVARELRDRQVVAFGLHAELMLAAALVAQQLHAPDLRIRHGLRHERGMVHGTAAWSERADDDSWRRIEYLESHDAILRAANPASPMRFCDVFFVGGMQIDREGSTNLIGLDGPGRLAVRGPGSIGTTSIATLAPKVILFSPEHTPRRFVDRVDHVSVPGWKRRAAVGLAGGPGLVITSLALLDFEEGEMRLRSVHPGVAVDDVVRATGFALRIPDEVPTTPPPSAAERAALQRLGPREDADEQRGAGSLAGQRRDAATLARAGAASTREGDDGP